MKSRKHKIEISLTFDRAVSSAGAVRAVRNAFVPSEICATLAEANAVGWDVAKITSANLPHQTPASAGEEGTDG